MQLKENKNSLPHTKVLGIDEQINSLTEKIVLNQYVKTNPIQ